MNIDDMKKEIEKRLEFDSYEYLMNNLNMINTKDYQKSFNSFYMVRRNNKWQKVYYAFFDGVKNSGKWTTYNDVITYLYEHLPKTEKNNKRVEASFSSKLLHTINPNMPILDKYILDNMNLSINGNTPKEKLDNAKKHIQKFVEDIKHLRVQKSLRLLKNYLIIVSLITNNYQKQKR